MRERVSDAALLCPGKCRMSEVNCEMKSKCLPRVVLVELGGENKRERLVV